MHVSLTRRSHRVGLSMQYLLWICFGLLAVVPWQVIRGQDKPTESRIDWEAGKSSVTTDDASSDDAARKKPKGVKKKQTDLQFLTIRSQSASSDPNPFTDSPQSGGGQPTQPYGSQSSPNYNLQPVQPFENRPYGGQPGTPYASQAGKAYGTLFSASVSTGPAIGRQNTIFPFEMMPYAFAGNSLFFGDVRGFFTTNPSNGGFGGNFGAGFRQYLPYFDRVLGVNAYYDYDNSSGALFREIGFGAESLGALYDVRANAYLPTGSSSQQISLTNINGTQIFNGHNLLVNQAKLLANALRGFDSEIGVPLPGRVAERHDIRVFGGGYYFSGDQIDPFGGWKIKATGNVTPNVSLNLQVSNDKQFHTNVVFGAAWTFGGYSQPDDQPRSQFARMTQPVVRSYNMIVGFTTQILQGVTVVDPTTGTPYFFEHVSDNASHPVATPQDNGTVEHPFLTLADAQAVATNNDIIFVHGNSAYTAVPVVLQPNIRVLGEATNVEHQVNTAEGLLNLPHPTAAPAVRPIFANSPGIGVVLANNSEFSGFQIGNIAVAGSGPAGIGISGNGVSNVVVRQTDVSFSGAQGVLLTNTGGTVTFLGDTINSPTVTTVPAFQVTGTTGSVIFGSDLLSDLLTTQGAPFPTPGTINDTGGMALLVQGTAAGSSVNFTGSTVNDTAGTGVLLTQNAGTVTIGDVNVTNGTGIGIDILSDSGVTIGNGTDTITGSAGDSIVIQNLAATGGVLFTNPGTAGTETVAGVFNAAGINIASRNARGIYLDNNAGSVTFLTPVSIQATGTVNLAAIEYQASSGNVTFDSPITIGTAAVAGSGGGVGVLIGGAVDALGNPLFNTGTFAVDANMTINNGTGIGVEVTKDKSTDIFSGGQANILTIADRGNIGVQVLQDQGTVTFSGTTTITNALATTLPGVDIRGNQSTTQSTTFNILNVQNATGPVSVPNIGGIGVNIGGVRAVDANSAPVTINTLNLGTAGPAVDGTALYVFNEGTTTGTTLNGLTITNGTIIAGTGLGAAGASAMDIENSTMRVTLTSVTSIGANAAAGAAGNNGITLINDQSFTPLPNQITSPSLNDFMLNVQGILPVAARNGGTIEFANNDGIFISQTKASLFQTGDVSLNEMTIQTNNGAAGISANGLLQLQVTNSSFTTNVHDGIIGINIPDVFIATSLFQLNGTTAADNAINLSANTLLSTTPLNATKGAYLWSIVDNGNNANSTDAKLDSPTLPSGFFQSAAAGSLVVVGDNGNVIQTLTQVNVTQVITPLTLTFFNNTATMTSVGSSALLDQWAGPQSGSINLNTITLFGNEVAINIADTDSINVTNFNIFGNTITGNGGSNVGILVNNFDPTTLIIGTYQNSDGTFTNNTFTFIAPAQAAGANALNNDVAIELSLLNSTKTATNIELLNNQITMNEPNGVSGMGIFFPVLQGPANVEVSNNNINITSVGVALGEGIYFQDVIGPGNVQFSGPLSNKVTINGANTIPNGVGVIASDWVYLLPLTASRSGQFFVNGFSFQ